MYTAGSNVPSSNSMGGSGAGGAAVLLAALAAGAGGGATGAGVGGGGGAEEEGEEEEGGGGRSARASLAGGARARANASNSVDWPPIMSQRWFSAYKLTRLKSNYLCSRGKSPLNPLPPRLWLQHPSQTDTPASGNVMGDFDCPHKFAQRDYVIDAFEGVRAKNPSLTRIIFIDTPKFNATNYFIGKGLNPRSLVAVCNKEFQVAPPGGITTINRNIYELEESEVVNVAVAWIDTCDTNIGYSRGWFKDSLDLFAAVPVVMVVNAFRGSHFVPHPEDMLPFYVSLHQEGARKGEATQVVRYTGKNRSSMIFSYSFLSGFAQLPFKCPSPLAVEEDNGEDDEEEEDLLAAGDEEGEQDEDEDDGDEDGEEDEEEEDLSTATGDEEGEEDEEEEDLSTNGPPSKRLRSVCGVGVLPRRGMEWCDDVGWVPQPHVKRIQVYWSEDEGGGWCKEKPFNGTLVINDKKKCVVEYDDGKRVKHVKGGRMCLSTFPSWKVLC